MVGRARGRGWADGRRCTKPVFPERPERNRAAPAGSPAPQQTIFLFTASRGCGTVDQHICRGCIPAREEYERCSQLENVRLRQDNAGYERFSNWAMDVIDEQNTSMADLQSMLNQWRKVSL